MHVGRPCAARLLDERPEHPLVAGERARVRRRGARARRRRAHLEHRDADRRAPPPAPARGRAARRRRRTPGTARSSRRPSSSTSASSSAAASSTAWLPTDATVWKRIPRPTASALTATFPLWETSATRPGSRGTNASPHSAAPAWKAISPSQFGPEHGQRPGGRRAARPAARRRPPPRTRPRTRRRCRSRAPAPTASTSGTPAAGIATTTASTASGRSSSDGTHGRPCTVDRDGCTPYTGPANPHAARLRSVWSP